MPDLFTAYRLKDVTLRNRIAISPMTMFPCASDGIVSDWPLVNLGARAVGGAGLVMIEQLAVSPEGRMTPGCAGIGSDDQMPALRRVTGFIKAHALSSAVSALRAPTTTARRGLLASRGSGSRISSREVG